MWATHRMFAHRAGTIGSLKPGRTQAVTCFAQSRHAHRSENKPMWKNSGASMGLADRCKPFFVERVLSPGRRHSSRLVADGIARPTLQHLRTARPAPDVKLEYVRRAGVASHSVTPPYE